MKIIIKKIFSVMILMFCVCGLSMAQDRGDLFELHVFEIRLEKHVEVALSLINAFPKPGEQSFLEANKKDYPHFDKVLIAVCDYKTCSELHQDVSGKPMTTVADGVAVILESGSKKNAAIFINTDFIVNSSASTTEVIAKLITALYHEVYGHLYQYFNDKSYKMPANDAENKADEIRAFNTSIACLENLLKELNMKPEEKLYKELNKVLENEKKMLKSYK
ncbi:hypothetical protein Dip510_001322 [Elusimicrobium posterum]|uniref:hypothetical protein n=1 Tax=Elusimicrobium posterum TaxID=3116653 RepID=UPI003C7274B1